jgi:predicted glycogen debranching enzyme
VRYAFEGSAPARIHLRPLVAFRDHHALARGTGAPPASAGRVGAAIELRPPGGAPTLWIEARGGAFRDAPEWRAGLRYRIEAERGLDCDEDLWSPGVFECGVAPGAVVEFIASTRDPRGRDPEALRLEEEGGRVSRLSFARDWPPIDRALAAAADQFVVRDVEGRATVIAGYPWFTDWGRDTMIAFPGLFLVTRRFEEARSALGMYAAHLDEGMIPNFFPDEGGAPQYNTIDATLWFVLAVHRYLAATGDLGFVRDRLAGALRGIVARHAAGTRHGIRMDADGLLAGGAPGMALTWMDAKLGGSAVTPRAGKPVEVNALWINALLIIEEIAARAGDRALATRAGDIARRARSAFAAFWNAAAGTLFDVIGAGPPDASIRPNALIAISLPHRLLQPEQERGVLDVVERDLLTPVGLRSAPARSACYIGRYMGPLRDAGYHQGTVWSWLVGPYLTALARVRGEDGRRQGREYVARFSEHLSQACVGTISEVFDGDPPHAPRGCFAQAWGVAEVLRAIREDLNGEAPPQPAPHGGNA